MKNQKQSRRDFLKAFLPQVHLEHLFISEKVAFKKFCKHLDQIKTADDLKKILG